MNRPSRRGLPAAPRRLRTTAFKFAFAALLVAVAFAATYTSSSATFSSYDLGNIVALGAAVNVVALLAALLLLRNGNAANAVLSLVVLASVGSAYLVHTDLWLVENRAVLTLLCAMSLAGLFVAFRVIDEWRWGGAVLSAAALLGLGAAVAGGNPLAAHTPVSGDVSNIRHVSFQRTPNLYFVSFESAAPRALLRKYLGLEASRFNDLLEDEMRRFSNLFADNIATAHALNTVLSLEVDVYHSQRQMLERAGRDPNPYLLSGQNPSPLLDILRRNGYETTSVYLNNYLGKRKGPYIDNYLRFSKVTVCDNLDPGLQNISFWGYCHWFETARRKARRINSRKWMVGEIEKASANDGPQFVMAHLPSPIHTNKFFNYNDKEHLDKFRKLYVGGDKAAGYLLDRIIRHLEENDPEAILLVYGDHGPHLSRHSAFGKDMTFRVQDMYGVAGAVWPRDACAVELDEASAKGWMTVLDAVHAILRCLSGGKSALVGPRKYVPRYGPIPPNYDFHYEDFLYE